MENSNELTTLTKVKAPFGIDENVTKTKRYWKNLYESVIGMMLYLE